MPVAIPRPPTVPASARFVEHDGASPHWHDGAEEPGSGQPLGPHTWWTTAGEPMRYARYDARGRLLFERSSLDLDLVEWLADELRRSPDRFDLSPLLGRFDALVHTKLSEVARTGTTLHRLTYAYALRYLDQRRGRTATVTVPRFDLILEVFAGAVARDAGAASDPDVHALVSLTLKAMLALGDRDGVKTWGPWWLAIEDPRRPRDRLPTHLRSEVQAFMAGEDPLDPVARAARSLHAVGLRAVLGEPGRTPLLLVDAHEQAYWLEGDDARSVPLEVDATGPSLTPWFVGVGPAPERSLFAERGRGWWLAQRYGRDWLLCGAARNAQTFDVEPVVDVFVRCPDDAWSERVRALFVSAWTWDSTRRDAFFDDEGVWLREYHVDIDHHLPRERAFLGVMDATAVHARLPEPGRRAPLRPRTPASVLPERFDVVPRLSRADAIAWFDTEERALLQRGYVLTRLHHLPRAMLHGLAFAGTDP